MKQLSIYDDCIEGAPDLFGIERTTSCEHSKSVFAPNPSDTRGLVTSKQIDTHIQKRSDHYNAPPATHVAAEANVTEIILTKDKADSIQLLLPMLTHLNHESRWLAWVDPPIQLLKKWRQQHNPESGGDIMVLRSSPSTSTFAITEKALTAGTCHAVIVWTDSFNYEEFSKLEVASSVGNSHGIILRYRKD